MGIGCNFLRDLNLSRRAYRDKRLSYRRYDRQADLDQYGEHQHGAGGAGFYEFKRLERSGIADLRRFRACYG